MKKLYWITLLIVVLFCFTACNVQIVVTDKNQAETTSPETNLTEVYSQPASLEEPPIPSETEHSADSEYPSEAPIPEKKEETYLLTESTITVYGNTPSILTTKYEYNDQHQISQMVHYYNGSESNRQTMFDYDAAGNPIKYTLSTPDGESTDYFTEYQYDENNNILLAETFVYTAMNEAYLYSSSDYYYDAQGRILSHTMRNAPMLDTLYITVYSYFYDDNGLAVKTQNYNQNTEKENIDYIYCDSAGNEVVVLSSSGVLYKKVDSAGNVLTAKNYRLGELLQSTTNSYQLIGTAQPVQAQLSEEDREIQNILDTYFSALSNNDTDALCELVPAQVHKKARESGVETSQYFTELDYLASHCLAKRILSSEVKTVGYNSSALVQEELHTEIFDTFGIIPDKTAVAMVDVELGEEYLTCALLLYRSEGEWYYMTSLLCQYADK